MELLSQDELSANLSELSNWEIRGKSIAKTFKTKGFPQTLGLAVSIGAICQQHDHHPDFMTLKYAELEVSFSTHSAGGITKKDIKIAKDIDNL